MTNGFQAVCIGPDEWVLETLCEGQIPYRISDPMSFERLRAFAAPLVRMYTQTQHDRRANDRRLRKMGRNAA